MSIPRRILHRVSVLLVAAAIWITSCSVDVGLGIGGSFVGVTILGRTITLSMGDVGKVTLKANVTVTVPIAFTLFTAPPAEVPASGIMTLPGDAVAVGRRIVAKAAERSQGQPPGGNATLRFLIEPGQSEDPCQAATLLSEYELVVTSGIVAVRNEDFPLSQEALAIIGHNEVTICAEITSDFDGDITFGDAQLSFDDPDDPEDEVSTRQLAAIVPGAATTQVPIDSLAGRAIAVAPNKHIGGISYAVVGVLEGVSPEVTAATTDPNTIALDLASLGLLRVEHVYMGMHSSLVPDVPSGVTIATLVVEYADGGAPSTLDCVLGENTAEWSYERRDHTDLYGGVRHGRGPVLYNFTADVGSTASYTSYSYAANLALDPARIPVRMTLEMKPAASFSGLRAPPAGTGAGQAITAMTLVGPAWIEEQTTDFPDDPDVACCHEEIGCYDIPIELCEAIGGSARSGECALVNCDEEEDDPDAEPVGACCAGDSTCSEIPEFDCVISGDDYRGDGVSCGAVRCDLSPENEFVVWHTGNVCCWGAPLMYISTRAQFNQSAARSGYPGGGRDDTIPVVKVELLGGFASEEEARNWICPQFESKIFHFWCRPGHYQWQGGNWQPGGLRCDNLSDLPDLSSDAYSGDFNGCADTAPADDDPPEDDDQVACCYDNATCVEQARVDCVAAGGTPQRVCTAGPNRGQWCEDGSTCEGHPCEATDLCGRFVCTELPPDCPIDGFCDQACDAEFDDEDCDNCGFQGSTNFCVTGCPQIDEDCCSSRVVDTPLVGNGDAEDPTRIAPFDGRPDFDTWEVTRGNFEIVSYGIAGESSTAGVDVIEIALNEADSVAVNGGNYYLAGGRSSGGIYSTAVTRAILPYMARSIEAGIVEAVLSADLGGWYRDEDHVEVRAVFGTIDLEGKTIAARALGSVMKLGPITRADRSNETKLIHVETSTTVPRPDLPGYSWMVFVDIYVTSKKVTPIGHYNDGYADNIRLELRCKDPG